MKRGRKRQRRQVDEGIGAASFLRVENRASSFCFFADRQDDMKAMTAGNPSGVEVLSSGGQIGGTRMS